MKRAAFIAAFLVLASGCRKDHNYSPTDPSVKAVVDVTMVEAASVAPVAGATVEVRHDATGPVLYSAKSDAKGLASVSVPPGTYRVHVVPPTGYAFAGGVFPDLPLTLTSGEHISMQVPLVRT